MQNRNPDESAPSPMFPLGTVLMPGGALPLHIFEPRYRALARRCVDNNELFGVVLIERGSEVGGGDVRTGVGTLARIEEFEELPDGRWAIIAVGVERVRIDEWLDDDPYPRARVSSLPDADGELSVTERATAVRRVVRVMALASEAGYRVPSFDLDDMVAGLDDTAFTYRLAASIPIGPLDRQALLAAPAPAARLELLEEILEGVEAVVRSQIADGAGTPPGDASDEPPSGML